MKRKYEIQKPRRTRRNSLNLIISLILLSLFNSCSEEIKKEIVKVKVEKELKQPIEDYYKHFDYFSFTGNTSVYNLDDTPYYQYYETKDTFYLVYYRDKKNSEIYSFLKCEGYYYSDEIGKDIELYDMGYDGSNIGYRLFKYVKDTIFEIEVKFDDNKYTLMHIYFQINSGRNRINYYSKYFNEELKTIRNIDQQNLDKILNKSRFMDAEAVSKFEFIFNNDICFEVDTNGRFLNQQKHISPFKEFWYTDVDLYNLRKDEYFNVSHFSRDLNFPKWKLMILLHEIRS